jgi:tyrosine-protein phosphatase SIW14
MRRAILVGTAIVVLAAGVTGVYAYRHHLKRFACVEPQVLYRSGMLTESQFHEVFKAHKIKTVFSFTFTDDAEIQRVCDEAGVKRYFHYLSGNGVGPDDPYLRFMQVVQDPTNHPILVHCSAGVQRTGGAVALYRTAFQHWPFEKAIAEMRAMGNDGNTPQIEQLRRLHQKLENPTPVRVARASRAD